jgi:predicted nuclease of predicted toxin-antitoxin system
MKRVKIYVDENIDYRVVKGLKRRGVNIITVQETLNLAKSDETQLEYAKSIDALFFTHDDDFLKIAKRWKSGGKSHNGIVYVHQTKLSVGEIIRKLRLLSETVSLKKMKNHIEFL